MKKKLTPLPFLQMLLIFHCAVQMTANLPIKFFTELDGNNTLKINVRTSNLQIFIRKIPFPTHSHAKTLTTHSYAQMTLQ